jgi:hypothetical protein
VAEAFERKFGPGGRAFGGFGVPAKRASALVRLLLSPVFDRLGADDLLRARRTFIEHEPRIFGHIGSRREEAGIAGKTSAIKGSGVVDFAFDLSSSLLILFDRWDTSTLHLIRRIVEGVFHAERLPEPSP